MSSLAELHDKAQRRVTMAAWSHNGTPYQPLKQRFDQVSMSGSAPARLALEADLRKLLEAPDETLKRMVYQGATDARCLSPAALANQEATRQLAVNESQDTRPRVSPAEVIAHFQARGIVLAPDVSGNLTVAPAALLSDTDRTLLRAHKASILDALHARVEVF